MVGTCESEISVRIDSRIESAATIRIRIESNLWVVVYMFNADCHVGVVYLIMCKPTACYDACSVFFVCTVGLRIYNLLITYDDDDQRRRQLFVNGGQGEGQLFSGDHLSAICTDSLVIDSFPFYIMTYRKAKQQYSVFY